MQHTRSLSEPAIRQYLHGHPWQDRIRVLDTVDSTNTYVKALAAKGAPHGTVVLADSQTNGRGRLGRSFSSPRGLGLYGSALLRFPVRPDRLLHLTPMAAVAAARAIETVSGVQPQIKWINDLVADGRKLCGILSELVVLPEETACVVGVGINCGQLSGDFPADIRSAAVSLRQLGASAERERLAAALIEQLAAMASDCTAAPELWMEAYRSRCLTIGRQVQLIRGDTVRQAFACTVDDHGALVVRLADGTIETVLSGEASVRGLYGYLK